MTIGKLLNIRIHDASNYVRERFVGKGINVSTEAGPEHFRISARRSGTLDGSYVDVRYADYGANIHVPADELETAVNSLILEIRKPVAIETTLYEFEMPDDFPVYIHGVEITKAMMEEFAADYGSKRNGKSGSKRAGR